VAGRPMLWRLGLATALLLAVDIGIARAQSAEVVAANQAFYAALSTSDMGAMEKAWAHEPYVFYVAPNSKTTRIGWPAVQAALQASLQASMSSIAERTVKPVEVQVRINGDIAWITGTEEGTGKRKDGSLWEAHTFVTNVFEKKDGRWLMVSHHAQSIPR
jgi:ketosteroid isomerase-like protein